MIIRSIRETILNDDSCIPGFVYVVRDSDVIFYVGLSNDPTFRLCQHLGIAGKWNVTMPCELLVQAMEQRNEEVIALAHFRSTQVGKAILDNAPESLSWSFDIYEKDDAIAVIERTPLPQALPALLDMMHVNWYEQRTLVESALIEQLKPCLNVIMNERGGRLPEKYQRRKIMLDDNAVDYIRL